MWYNEEAGPRPKVMRNSTLHNVNSPPLRGTGLGEVERFTRGFAAKVYAFELRSNSCTL
jgi:hypothetical protein